jgi:hypothetical protein
VERKADGIDGAPAMMLRLTTASTCHEGVAVPGVLRQDAYVVMYRSTGASPLADNRWLTRACEYVSSAGTLDGSHAHILTTQARSGHGV